MDKRLILSVLLVMLSWEFLATNAQTNNATTVAPASNATTTMAPASNAATTAAPASNAATTAAPASNAATTAAPASNATASNATTTAAPASNATASNATTMAAPASNATASNATTTAAPASNATASNASTTAAPASNATASNASTTAAPASNATASNATTMAAPASNATASNATTMAAPASNATASNASTTAVPASNATGSNATTAAPSTLPAVQNISRQECGSSKLCAAEPSECDPATGNSCFFLSAKQQSGQRFNFELSGQTEGYIAAGLSRAATQNGLHRAYVCANNNGAVRFFTGFLNNLELNLTETLDSSNVRGSVNSGKIQCTFSAVLPDTSTRAAGYAISFFTGLYNASSGQPEKASFRILTPLVNLSDPTTNITNLLNNSTSNSTSSAYPVTHTQSFLPVLLVTVSMLAFTAV
ncbi:uncharacterized protein FYW61_019219 [Anableps anableps]